MLEAPNRLNFFSAFKLLVIFCLLALVGLFVLPLLNLKLTPEQSDNRVFVNFNMRAETPRSIEKNVTSRLEGIAASLKGVSGIESVTRPGEGVITVWLDKHTHPDQFRVKLSSAIRQAWNSFPQQISFPVISSKAPFSSKVGNQAIMSYRVESEKDSIWINDYLTNNLIPNLYKVKGLKQVLVDGLPLDEVHILIDHKRARMLGVSDQQIFSAFINSNQVQEISSVPIKSGTNGVEQYNLKVQFNKTHEVNLDQILVESFDKRTIRLSELAKIHCQRKTPNRTFRVNGVPNIYLRLFADEKQNHLKLAGRIKEQIAIHQQNQPEDIGIFLVSDSTQFIKKEIYTIAFRTLLTLFLLLMAVWLFYRDANYLIIVVISLTTNVCISFLIYYLFGLELHFYTMAGITLSLGMIIDNSIIVVDYLKKHTHLRILLPLLAANLTTIGALMSMSIISIRQESFWDDFSHVIVINLFLSFFASLFLVPSLVKKIPLKNLQHSKPANVRRIIKFNHLYAAYARWAVRHKTLIVGAFILGFGLPIFMLPNKVGGEAWYHDYYNKIFSNPVVENHIKPAVDKITGGTLRLFVNNIISDYQTTAPHEKILLINAHSQKEYSYEHLNRQVMRLEEFLLGVGGIKGIQTEVSQTKRATIKVSFKENESPMLGYDLLDEAAKHLNKYAGGADWSLSYEQTNVSITYEIKKGQSWGINLYGYNFDELLDYARQTQNRITQNPRVRNAHIRPQFSFFATSNYQSESLFSFDKTLDTKTKADALNRINRLTNYPIPLGQYNFKNRLMGYYLNRTNPETNLFQFMNQQRTVGASHSRMNLLGTIKKVDTPLEIARHNQQYQLAITFDFMGTGASAKAYEKELIQNFNNLIIPGFFAGDKFGDSKENPIQWLGLIVLIISIIYFITSILFESLKQGFWVIAMIPFSYIGAFLAFWFFNVNFDQGGYGSLIILEGITVNASLYFINAFNNQKTNIDSFRKFLKAWNTMITPIFLTILSTILGFIPFLIKGSDVFWRALATGTIGGLIFSLFVLFVILPVSLIKTA